MRKILIDKLKNNIEASLKTFLREEGIELYIAANDNIMPEDALIVELEHIHDCPLEGSELISEIRVQLGIQGKPWQCDALVNGIYLALCPHYITPLELSVLLMSLHVEIVHCVRPRHIRKRTIFKYVVENQ